PGTQQWRCFHLPGEYALRSADEGVYAEGVDPGAQGTCAEVFEQRRDLRAARAITQQEFFRRLGMGDVQPAFARKQELAADGGHGIVNIDVYATRVQDFRR